MATLRETSPGAFSGTFYDSKPGLTSASEGRFTNVHVHPPKISKAPKSAVNNEEFTHHRQESSH
ncbi:hypothetical protein [Hymenobacter coccineus]|uniref:Uncharacterized protein n=1 Tax=Hymenobacter coccineus TaxID=1908235 RepID=A0A1G1TK77_9BACT|nr:hypothetical protein [Hymenobacter coccineus]OGX91267.1 hypothetical protein BEN49_20440 [Hymenobacter coccineus]